MTRDTTVLNIGGSAFDPSTRRLCGSGGERRLSPKATAVLLALAETPGQVWSRTALLERAWPNVFVGEEVLTQAVAEIRRAFADSPRNPQLIETIHKSGYRLLTELTSPSSGSGDAAEYDERPLFDLHSYALYLEGAALFDRGHKSNTKAAEMTFRRILERNPDFAIAHVGLAKAITFLTTYYEPADCLDGALGHCRTAKRIDPSLADAYAVEGLILAIGGHFGKAKQQFARALSLDPNNGEIHYMFGRACFAELNIELAAPMLERSAALRPDDYHSLMLAGKARQMLQHDEQALRNFALTVSRTNPFVEAFPNDTRALCAEARARLHLGQATAARVALEKARYEHEPCFHMACTFAQAGDGDGALDLLEQVVESGWKHVRWLERDPDFRAYQYHPRFQRIARSLSA